MTSPPPRVAESWDPGSRHPKRPFWRSCTLKLQNSLPTECGQPTDQMAQVADWSGGELANLVLCSTTSSTVCGIVKHDCSVVVSHREEVQILMTARLTGTIFGGAKVFVMQLDKFIIYSLPGLVC